MPKRRSSGDFDDYWEYHEACEYRRNHQERYANGIVPPTVNPLKAKQLTNIRTVIKDDNVLLAAPNIMSLEQSLEFIQDDELVEVTPGSIRIRKLYLKEHERKAAGRASKKQDS